MKESLITIVMPSEEIRKILPKELPDFGTEYHAAGIGFSKVQALPMPWSPDVVLMSDKEATDEILSELVRFSAERDYLYFARHSGANSPTYGFMEEMRAINRNAAFANYHRTHSDPIFNGIKDVIQSLKATEETIYAKNLEKLLGRFGVNWELDEQMLSAHRDLHLEQVQNPEHDTVVLWNEDHNGKTLIKELEEDCVVTSEYDLKAGIEGKKRAIVLCELTWDDYRMSQLHGYEIAEKLILKGSEVDLLFVSVLDREVLKRQNKTARVLGSIFPHICLAKKQSISGPFQKFSETKWRMVRHYYLRPDGIVDKICHDLKNLETDPEIGQIRRVLEDIVSFREILPPRIVDLAVESESLLRQNSEWFSDSLQQLSSELRCHYMTIAKPAIHETAKSKYRIILIEDNETELEILRQGLGSFFSDVRPYTSAIEAMEELKRRPDYYSAVVADMELLDESGNFQEIQGYDFIDAACNYPHLVIYMLTHFSKRALSYIRTKGVLGRVRYLSKSGRTVLPPELNFSEFSNILVEEIETCSKFRIGPKNGPWLKGLLHLYYQVVEASDGSDLWQDVIERVEQLVAAGLDNSAGIIPTSLFSIETVEYDRSQLEVILMHRLATLFYQMHEPRVEYDNGLKKAMHLTIKGPKPYLNSLLGFSAVCETEGDGRQVCIIQKKNLFPQEWNWLREQFPREELLNYPGLLEALSDVLEYVPNNIKSDFPQQLLSFEDCRNVLKLLLRQSWSKIDDMIVAFDFFLEDQQELSHLCRNLQGKEILEMINKFMEQASN